MAMRTTGGHVERDALERPAPVAHGRVAEPDVLERHAASARGRRQRHGSLGRGDGRRLAQQLVDPLDGRRAPLQQVDGPAQRDHRPHQHRQVDAERHEGPGRDGARDHEPASGVEHDDPAQSAQQRHQRMECALHLRHGEVSPEVFVVEAAEVTLLGALLAVGPHHAHAGQVLLHIRAHRAEVLLDGAGAFMHHAAEHDHHDGQPEQREQRQQAERQADVRHLGYDERSAYRGVHEVHQGGARHHADGREVVRGACHEIAGGMAVEETGRMAQEVGEQVVPHLRLDAPTAAVERLAHAEPGDAAHDRDAHEHHRAPGDHAERGAPADLVDAPLQEARARGGERVGDQHQHQAEHVGCPVTADVREKGAQFAHHHIPSLLSIPPGRRPIEDRSPRSTPPQSA